MEPFRIFLLSPANCGGKRAALLFRGGADFDLARRLRSPEGAPIGEVFAFISGLYFRGKLAYAGRFARPPDGLPGSLVITTDRGLVDPASRITLEELRACADVPIDLAEPRYREPLAADLERLADASPDACDMVLLGSIATAKYLEPLLDALGPRLYFPETFVGRGDMQRGSILLKAARAGEELASAAAAESPAAGGAAARGGAR